MKTKITGSLTVSLMRMDGAGPKDEVRCIVVISQISHGMRYAVRDKLMEKKANKKYKPFKLWKFSQSATLDKIKFVGGKMKIDFPSNLCN